MERVVVVGIVPVDAARRYVAFLVRCGQPLDRLGGGGPHLRVLGVELAVRGHEVLAAIGDQEGVEGGDRVDPVGGQLIAIGVDVAHPLLAQAVLHRFEEVEEGIPGVRDIGDLEARLLDQRVPDVERPAGDPQRHHVVAALFGDAVVVVAGVDRDRDEIFFLRLDDVADIEELVVPGVQRGKFEVGGFDNVRHRAALDRRDRLLAQRRKRDDAELDLVAARLLIIGDDPVERGVFLLGETLRPPHLGGGRGRVGDVWPRQSAERTERKRTAQQRTPSKARHLGLLPCSSRARLLRSGCG